MNRDCDVCGRTYTAKSPRSQYCGEACAKRAQRGTPVIKSDPVKASGLLEATRSALEAACKLDSVPGQQAVRIAEQMAGPETGAGLAALSKALSAVMAEALGNVKVVGDAMDELKAKREKKRAG